MSSPANPSRAPKVALRLVIIAVVLAGGIWGGRIAWQKLSPALLGNKRQEKIPTSRTRTASIAEEIVAVGRLRAVFSTELRSEINGRIVKILAVDGQKVDARSGNHPLGPAGLADPDPRRWSVRIEAAKLKAASAPVATMSASLDLQKRGVVTDQGFRGFPRSRSPRSAENDSAIAEARVANLRDKLTKTVHARARIQRNIAVARFDRGPGRHRAPRPKTAACLLGEVADLSMLMVRTNINEIDVARLKMGDVARVRVDSMRSLQRNRYHQADLRPARTESNVGPHPGLPGGRRFSTRPTNACGPACRPP